MIKPQKKYASQSRNEMTSLIVSYVVLTILALIWIIPILWIVLSAFRGDVGIVSPNYIPSSFGIENFKTLFTATYYGVEYAFLRWMLNTLIVAVVDCVISTFLILSVAYCMSKLRFKLRKAFMNLTMVIGLFPGFMSMIAIYFLLKAVGLAGNTSSDTAWLNLVGLILAYSAGRRTARRGP